MHANSLKETQEEAEIDGDEMQKTCIGSPWFLFQGLRNTLDASSFNLGIEKVLC
jgi:hypothetical protein